MKNSLDIMSLVRPNIQKLKPYSSARNEFSGASKVFLDANENPWGQRYNRYPDPTQGALKKALSTLKGIPSHQLFLGNGSDEGIDILIRVFCEPGHDNIIITEPTYGMYEVSADINNVEIKRCALSEDFKLDSQKVLDIADEHSKILFLCSPNNPTGNLLEEAEVRVLLDNFKGIVVIDEAYIDYSGRKSWTSELSTYPNLVVLQTMSKAWGLAAIRLGLGFASKEIIDLMNKVKPPYNISLETQQIALKALEDLSGYKESIEKTLRERDRLMDTLERLPFIEKIFSSDANFILMKVQGARKLYEYLIQQGIVVRDRSGIVHCESCLRITVGTTTENETLINALNNYQ